MEPTSAKRPKLGLALSGGGNRSSFYIGFLEIFQETRFPIDYITACSGGSLVAAAYACGTLKEFKERVFTLDRQSLRTYFTRNPDRGGLFSMDLLEEEIRSFTKGLRFEDVRPLMGFVAVDIESGDKVLLSMGDIARAARISCTLPGIFSPVKWGGKTLVDGGLLSMVPGDFLRQAGMDLTVGIDLRGTKHIFTENQINLKKIYNFFRKILLINEIESLFGDVFRLEDERDSAQPGFFQVVGKSLDLAILANKKTEQGNENCDINIVPAVPMLKQSAFNRSSVKFYYDMGRQIAKEYLPQIEEALKVKA